MEGFERKYCVTFGDLEENDIYNLAKSIEYVSVAWENTRLGKSLCHAVVMYLTDNKEEILLEIEQTYAPQLYMLNNFIKKNKNENVLQYFRDAAKKSNRCDVELYISELQTTSEQLTPPNLQRLSTMLETTSYSKWSDWKCFADTLGYNMKEIHTMSYYHLPSMKAIRYMKDNHPDESIITLQYVHNSMNVCRCEKLDLCIYNIKNRLLK